MLKRSPKITVGAIIEKNNKILLTKRNIKPFIDQWCFPGGHVNFGETVQQAIVREVKEETNLDFVPNFLGYYDEIYPKINWHAVSLAFFGKAKGKEKIDKKEVKEMGWFSQKEIKTLKLAFETKRILGDYFKKYKKK